MRVLALTGVLILVPAAASLHVKADAQAFDAAFCTGQAIELRVGALPFMWLTRNAPDGLRLSGKQPPASAPAGVLKRPAA